MLDDEKIEQYLSKFQPRVVRPLAPPQPATRLWPRGLAIAAAVLLCAGISFWYEKREPSKPAVAKSPAISTQAVVETGRTNAFALTKLALTDEAQFEAQLAAESRTELPSFQGNSTLRILSKE